MDDQPSAAEPDYREGTFMMTSIYCTFDYSISACMPLSSGLIENKKEIKKLNKIKSVIFCSRKKQTITVDIAFLEYKKKFLF